MGHESLTKGSQEERPTTCNNPTGCERALHNGGDNRLTGEEYSAPAHCSICQVPLCDMCAAWADQIPVSRIPRENTTGCTPSPNAVTSGILCGEHFNEDWV